VVLGATSVAIIGIMQNFRNLAVWTKAHALAVACYRLAGRIQTRRFPDIASQLRRAASSIPANISEGCGQRTSPLFVRHLAHGVASAHELEYHLIFAADVGAIPKPASEELQERLSEVRRMLIGLITKIDNDERREGKRGPRDIPDQG
jgi:four helix bundle protein